MSWLRVALAVGRRPGLWSTSVRQMRRTAPTRWWRRAPYLPVPSGEYLHFRMVTQYGAADHRPEPADVVSYLAWCKQFRLAASD